MQETETLNAGSKVWDFVETKIIPSTGPGTRPVSEIGTLMVFTTKENAKTHAESRLRKKIHDRHALLMDVNEIDLNVDIHDQKKSYSCRIGTTPTQTTYTALIDKADAQSEVFVVIREVGTIESGWSDVPL